MCHYYVMTTDSIKKQLTDFRGQFQENSGLLKSYEVVYNYINFLRAEPYLIKLMSSHFDYGKQQLEIIVEMAQDSEKKKLIDNIKINPKDLSCPEIPFFVNELSTLKENVVNEADSSLMISLPIYLMNLVMISNEIEDIKDFHNSGDTKLAHELIDDVKNQAIKLETFDIFEGVKNPPIFPSALYTDFCIEMVNKHIIDHIDTESLLNGDKPKKLLSFDKNNSILNIRGTKIKINRKEDLTIEHFILQAIFDQEDISEEVYFRDIAKNYLEMLEYDADNDSQKFRHACDRLNSKVDNCTGNKITKFIEYHIGKKGRCMISPKHL